MFYQSLNTSSYTLQMYTIYKVYEEAKVLCCIVFRLSVDNTSSYSRTTEECSEHLLTARVYKFLLYSQISRMKK